MIQRIQTIWLLLTAACAFLTIRLPFYSGHKMDDPQKTYAALNATTNMLLLILTVAIGIACLISIFLFKNRKLQMRITLVALLVSLLNIFLYYNETKKFIAIESSLDLSCVFVFAIPVLLFLAFRGIYKDEKLIKSVDRLR
jgi:hypothetical protein